MSVTGIALILFLTFHCCMNLVALFSEEGYNMMFAEIFGVIGTHSPSDGFAYIVDTFSNPIISILYLVWFCAIWFHIAHGFWSAMHTLGLSGKIWLKRMQCIGLIWVSLVVLGFAAVVLAFWFGCAPSLCTGTCA